MGTMLLGAREAGLASKQTKARASDWSRVGDFVETATEEVVDELVTIVVVRAVGFDV